MKFGISQIGNKIPNSIMYGYFIIVVLIQVAQMMVLSAPAELHLNIAAINWVLNGLTLLMTLLAPLFGVKTTRGSIEEK